MIRLICSTFATTLAGLDRFGNALSGARPGGWRWAILFAALAWALYAAHWPLTGQVIPWDAKDYYYPVLRALASARASGDSGFWNPYLYSGDAAVADPQSWLFVPGFRLLAEWNAAPSMMLVDGVQLLHLLIGGFGVLLLLRALGFAPVAGLLAALVFMFGGVAASRLQHSLMTVSYAYLPWALWLLQRALHAQRTKTRMTASVGFGLVAGVMALDRDQTAFLNCWLLIGATLWWLGALWRREQTIAVLQRGAGLLPAVLMGGVILALPVLLTLDALAHSTRLDMGYALAAYGSQQPASLLTLLAPNVFGNLTAGGYWGPGRLPWMALAPLGNDWTDETTNYLYIGALPLTLLLVAVARRGAWPRASGLFAAGLAFALLYALGAFTPVFRLFYDWLPGAALYRRPNDAAFLFNAMLAFLAGAALQKWLTTPRVWSALRSVIVATMMAIAIVAAIWLAVRFGHVNAALVALAIGGASIALAATLLLWPTRHMAAMAVTLCLLTALDLIVHNAAARFNAQPQEQLTAYGPAGEHIAEAIRSRLGDAADPYRAEIFGLGGDWQNAAMGYGIEQTLGYDPLRDADYVAATGAYQNNHLPERRLTETFTGYDSSLARLLGIKIVAVGKPIEDILPLAARRSLRFVGQVETAYLYENAGVLPRLMIVTSAAPDIGQALPADPERLVLIAGLSAPQADAEERSAGNARILLRSRSEWRIAVALERPAYLVINELYHPGWMAWAADGTPLTILRANRLFRAIALPAGHHEIRLAFHPFAATVLAADVGESLSHR